MTGSVQTALLDRLSLLKWFYQTSLLFDIY